MDFSDPNFWLNAILSIVVFILSLSVHEYAHARVAFWLGDDTASRMGRLTLNPIPHIDPIGTIVMPILGASGIPVIGWAKPVPVSPVNFTRKISMKSGMALTAVAGPLSNVILALLCVTVLWALFFSSFAPNLPRTVTIPFMAFLVNMSFSNIGLAVFNLLPIPPLDGSRLMPRSMDNVMETLQRYSFMLFIVIILFGGRFLIIPIRFIIELIYGIFGMNFYQVYGLISRLSGS